MSNEWVDNVTNRLEGSGQVELANTIRDAKRDGKLTKTVTAIKRTDPGRASIVTIKVK
jgi:hypothetical protein